MSQLISDIVYKDLKEKGLELTQPIIFVIPEPTKKKTFMDSFGGFLRPKQDPKQSSKIIAFPILASCILVANQHMIYIYKYEICPETSQILVAHHGTVEVPFEVTDLKSCDHKYVKDRNQVPVLVLGVAKYSVYIFDLKAFKLEPKYPCKEMNNLFGIRVLTEKQILIIWKDGNYQQLSMTSGKVTEKNKNKAKKLSIINYQIGQEEILRKQWIFSDVDEENKSLITLIYATTRKTDENMTLRIKEIFRTPEGQIIVEQQSDFILESDSIVFRDKFKIESVQDYFCLEFPGEISIMKKKFNKYMVLDALEQRFNDHTIFLNAKGIVASMGNKIVQLSSIKFNDPKSSLRVCDVINLPKDLNGLTQNFVEIWPILNGKQYTLFFVFRKGYKIYLSNIIKKQPLEKMMELVKNQEYNLQIVRDMAVNLGISNKNFYLKLWSTSNKQKDDIYNYLLPCNDVASIKKQLNNLLRRKTVPVSEMIKILMKMSIIIKENLKVNLNQLNIKDYVKNQFLRRKLKLNESNKMLDHNSFEKIYNSSLLSTVTEMIGDEIAPVEIIIDPLHPMSDESPYKEIKILQNVFQEFKVILLEDYRDFLISVFEKFPGKLLQIINRYHFLLPNFPFEINVQKPSKINQPIIKNLKDKNNINQPLWFQEVTVTEWGNQMTKEKILEEFYEYYQTSKISETVDEFLGSINGKQKKRGSHGLINLNLEEFTLKIKEFQGIRLYLEVCEYANEKSIENDDDPEISLKILQILEKKNRLVPPQYDYCILYARMHYFMLKRNIVGKQKLKIYELTQLNYESLVALFFLENKQKKQYIFREFMELYQDKGEFQNVLRKFVESENCSKIELEILMKQVIELGKQFQRQNQQIIEILLIGQCMKLEVREHPAIIQSQKDSNLPNLIDNIEISKALAFKINKIKQLKKCENIFDKFNCSKMTYEELLALQESSEIIKLLLRKYFDNDMNDKQLVIEDQLIDLQSPRNMLTMLIYLQETVYYSIPTFELLIQYGLTLIEWKEFEVISNFLAEEHAFNALQVRREQFVENLITRALDTIYLDLQIIYDPETKQQILNVINIDPDSSSPLKIQQTGKLDFVDILESWGCSVHPCDIHTICHQWSEYRRKDFIEDLIAEYIDKLTFQSFEAVYTQLEIIDNKSLDININNEEYVQFCKMYSFKLLEKGRYSEVIQIFKFLRSLANITINFSLESEAFLMSILHKYPDNLQLGRKFIEYFIQINNTQLDFNIKKLYESGFDEESLILWERQDKIKVNSQLLYKKADRECHYILDDLWKISTKNIHSPKDAYYGYYFLINSLIFPSNGLTKIHGISYSYERNTDLLLNELENYNNQKPDFWAINMDEILQRYLKGLLGEAMQRLAVNNEIEGTSKLQAILEMLKSNRDENNELIKSLIRIRQQLKSKLKRSQRKNRFLNFLEELAIEQEKQRKMRASLALEEFVDQAPQEQVYLTWKVVEEQKKNLTSQSQFPMSEKQLIDQAFQILGENVTHEPKKNQNRRNILPNIFTSTVNNLETINSITELIRKEDVQNIAKFDPSIINEAIKNVFDLHPDTDPYLLVQLMENAALGDVKKLQIFKLTKFFVGSLKNQEINYIFNYDFLTKPLESEEDYDYNKVYEELQPRIQKIVKQLSPEKIKDLSHLLGNCLESSEYSALVFLETLTSSCNNWEFKSNSAIWVHQFIIGLGEYPQIIANKYQTVLQTEYKDPELHAFLKECLSKLMFQKGYDEIAQAIKSD